MSLETFDPVKLIQILDSRRFQITPVEQTEQFVVKKAEVLQKMLRKRRGET